VLSERLILLNIQGNIRVSIFMADIERITSSNAATLIRSEASKALVALNRFSHEAFRTRGGRLGSGMGSLLEALWVYFMNRTLHNEGGVAADCEIGWLEDHEPNDFACVLRDAMWRSTTREGELFRIEAKSMNASVDESKGHFTELSKEIGVHDQLLILIWKWTSVDTWRSYPAITDYLLCPALPIAELRDLLHMARGGTFVKGGKCPDGCAENPCKHTSEPLNAAGKRERKGGPESTRPSAKVAFANNFGGLVRMLKTDNENARQVFRKARASNSVAHEYISFIHRNFPNEESNQYTLIEWQSVANHVGLNSKGKKPTNILEELKATTPGYQELLRDLFTG
jgi:hypothetical protein